MLYINWVLFNMFLNNKNFFLSILTPYSTHFFSKMLCPVLNRQNTKKLIFGVLNFLKIIGSVLHRFKSVM